MNRQTHSGPNDPSPTSPDAEADIRVHLPLSEVTYFILLSLAPQPRHGYAIMKDVRALSDDRVRLSTGTLYSALKRLLERGWIKRAGGDHTAGSGRQRKTYALTHRGRRVLAAEVERLEALVRVAQICGAGGRA